MHVTIPRIDSDEKHLCIPGRPAWAPVSDGVKPLKPIIRCNCGRFVGLALHHVHADGTVTASFLHGKMPFVHNGKQYSGDPQGCEWHVFLTLANYDRGDFSSEP